MNKRTIILLLLLLLLSIIGNIYYFSKANESKEAYENQKNAIEQLHVQKDSLIQVLNGFQEELQVVWSENNLGIDKIGELEKIQATQQSRIASLLTMLAAAKNTDDVKSLKSQVAQLIQEKEILSKNDLSNSEKIVALKNLNKDLGESNETLKKDNIEKTKILVKAQKPNFNELLISPIRIRKDQEELAVKAKHVSFLRIKLKMFQNPITDKSIILPLKVRIISPDGAILTKDTKQITDKKEISTVLEIVNFSGQEKNMKWDYKHNAELEKGVYKYELIIDGELIQVGSFSLE